MISFSVSIAISFLSLVTRINSSSFAEEYVNNHNDDLFDQVNSNNNDLQEDPSLFDSNINDYDSIFLSSSSSSPSFEDDANTDLLADCLTPDRLGARDAETTKECPANNNLMTIPQLPTLDQLINKAVPVDGTDEEQNLALPSPAVVIPADPQAQNKRICPWYRPFYLCCLCDVAQTTEYCQDCLPMSSVAGCFAPHMAVCCITYGTTLHGDVIGRTNLAQWALNHPEANLGLNSQGGTIAEYCSDRDFLLGTQ